MKKETKKKIKKLTIKILKIIGIGFLIYIIYSMGFIRGVIEGMYQIQDKNNETICDLMNKTRDTDGFCILREGEYKYRSYLDCGWEKFKIEGEKKPPLLWQLIESLRRIVYYPALGCY